MLTKHRIYFTILLTLLFSTISCNRYSSPYVQQIDPTVKKYFSYRDGTYWIYRDSLTGEIDSFIVTLSSTSISHVNNQSTVVEAETINVYNNNILDTFGLTWGLGYGGITCSYWPDYQNSIHLLFVYPYARFDTMYSSYELFGNIFDSVARFTEIDTSLNARAVFFVSRDAGIVKMRLNNPTISLNRVWEVKRYSILH